MSKIYFLTLLVIGVVTGVVVAYGVGEMGLDPRIDQLEDSLELASLDLKTELDRVSSLQTALDFEKSVSLQQVERSEERISQLEGFLSSRDQRIESLDRSIEDLQARKEDHRRWGCPRQAAFGGTLPPARPAASPCLCPAPGGTHARPR
ncbi:MAG: hypothetical protein ACE5KG_06765, partial [Nitrososphaerales archaeon]